MIRRLLTPPRFEDDELNRQVSMLNTLVWSTLSVTIVLNIALAFSGTPLAILAIVGIMSLISIFTIYSFRRGQVKLASTVFIFAGWSVMMVSAALQDGLTSPFTWFAGVMVLLTSLLLDNQYIKIITGLSLLAITLLFLNELNPSLPQLLAAPTSLRRFTSMVAAFVAIGLLARRAMVTLHSALDMVRQDRDRLVETNRLLEETQAVLEQRVADRTAALEAHAGQLQAVAEVAGAIASIRDEDQLLNEVTSLISERFGYYHVGIYLPDESGQTLALRAANTEIGRRLIEAGFNLPLDQPAMATSTARTRKARVAADVRMDDQYQALDDLSLTCSEITLPLISSDKLLGVLDLQDAQVRAPSSEDLATLRILANQIAIAIDNAQLFASSQKSLESLQRAYGAMSREGWQKVLRSQTDWGYRAGASGPPAHTSGEWQPEMAAAQTSGLVVQSDPHTLIVPIKIREQVAGVVKLRKPPEASGWRPDEITLVQTLSDRLSAALESARLYEETRRRAERERLTGEITARMRASNDPQEILQVAARELRKALQADRAQLVVQYETEAVLPPTGGQD